MVTCPEPDLVLFLAVIGTLLKVRHFARNFLKVLQDSQ